MLLVVGLGLAYGLARGVLDNPFVVVTLVSLGLGAGLLVSYLIQAPTLRSRPKEDHERTPSGDA